MRQGEGNSHAVPGSVEGQAAVDGDDQLPEQGAETCPDGRQAEEEDRQGTGDGEEGDGAGQQQVKGGGQGDGPHPDRVVNRAQVGQLAPP